jgi:A/G-specific adenine glycosylase
MTSFAARIVAWQKEHGRHDLPWQGTRDPYRIWLAEIMLQQTQVATVIPYYLRFLSHFPTIGALAAAPLDEVLRLWSGLGYYARARNLHRAAQAVVGEHGGRFPGRLEEVSALPGVGRSTAAAVSVFAFGAREAILDGNVKRVLARYRGVKGFPGDRPVADRLWREAERLLPRRHVRTYTQGLMDLGAGICTRAVPRCAACPVHADCVAFARGVVGKLPAPRPRKRRPHKRTIMLALTCAGEVLLEKRPAPGLWGGMWCLPEIGRNADLEAHCLQRFGAHVRKVDKLPTLGHGFTHFTVDIRPLHVTVSALVPHAAEPGHVWLPLKEAQRAAIPVPVRKILAQLEAHGFRARNLESGT